MYFHFCFTILSLFLKLVTCLIYSFLKNSSDTKKQEPKNKCTFGVRGQTACLAANHILMNIYMHKLFLHLHTHIVTVYAA